MSKGNMKCPHCTDGWTRIYDSRRLGEGYVRIIYHQCKGCGKKMICQYDIRDTITFKRGRPPDGALGERQRAFNASSPPKLTQKQREHIKEFLRRVELAKQPEPNNGQGCVK